MPSPAQKERTLPPALRAGDTIGVIAPAGPITPKALTTGLAALERRGYRPIHLPSILDRDLYFAGSVERRLDELHRMFADPEVKGIVCFRGGYGANYLLPLLERLEIGFPKVVVASSDVSYLLWYLLERRQMVVFYGPMVYGALAAGEYDRDQVPAALAAKRQPLHFRGQVLCPGRAAGLLTGGCLSNFASLLGTPHLPELQGRILLLEDVNERAYRLDRMLWQCEQAGVFRLIRGLLLGEFPNCFKDNGERAAFYGRWREKLAALGFPVLYDMPFGHAASAQLLPLGVNAEIDSGSSRAQLSCETGVE
jgi:muramoyltetrapeptide carboxypeptidase